jgi:uncharacterized protein YndB with AHSA1/START domain
VTTTSLVLEAPRERIWAIISTAESYSDWVVGAKDIRGVEGPWPQPGSRFHHTIGVGPFTLQDDTKSLETEEPWHLVIEARGRPLGRARVEFTLTPLAEGTKVKMDEKIVAPSLMRSLGPLLAPLIRRRNDETLRRLACVVGASAVQEGEPRRRA